MSLTACSSLAYSKYQFLLELPDLWRACRVFGIRWQQALLLIPGAPLKLARERQMSVVRPSHRGQHTVQPFLMPSHSRMVMECCVDPALSLCTSSVLSDQGRNTAWAWLAEPLGKSAIEEKLGKVQVSPSLGELVQGERMRSRPGREAAWVEGFVFLVPLQSYQRGIQLCHLSEAIIIKISRIVMLIANLLNGNEFLIS